jgi:hypothetical protein
VNPSRIHQILSERFPELVASPRSGSDVYAYFLGEIKGGQASTRVLRVSEHPSIAEASRLKLPVSTRINSGREVLIDFSGTEDDLLVIVRGEIDLLSRRLGYPELSRARADERQPMTKTREKQAAALFRPAHSPQSRSLTFEVASAGIDEAMPLLYMWEIFDYNDSIAGVYVGKAATAARPLGRYSRVIRLLLADKAYPYGLST